MAGLAAAHFVVTHVTVTGRGGVLVGMGRRMARRRMGARKRPAHGDGEKDGDGGQKAHYNNVAQPGARG